MLLDAGLTPQVDYKAVMTGENNLQSLRLGKVDALVSGNPRYRAALKRLMPLSKTIQSWREVNCCLVMCLF